MIRLLVFGNTPVKVMKNKYYLEHISGELINILGMLEKVKDDCSEYQDLYSWLRVKQAEVRQVQNMQLLRLGPLNKK